MEAKVRDLRRDSSRPPGPWLRLVCALACAAATATTPAARAQQVTITVVPVQAAPERAEEARRLTGFLEAELSTQEARVRLLRPPQPLREPTATRAELMRGLLHGSRQLAAGGRGAAGPLSRIVALALENPGEAPVTEVVDALALLGLQALREGDEQAARAAWAQALRFSPGLKLRGRRIPAAARREFQRVATRVLRGRRGTLTVEGPEGAIAFVDGRRAGAVPATVRRLPYGDHLIRIEVDGRRLGQRVTLNAASETFRLSFPKLIAAPAVPAQLDEAAVQALAQYGRELGAEVLLFGRLVEAPGGLTVGSALLRVADGRPIALREVRFAGDVTGAAGAALSLVEDAMAKLEQPGVPPPFDLFAPPAPPEPPVVEITRPAPVVAVVPPAAPARLSMPQLPWWVYAGAGVVVVGAATTAGVLYVNRPVTGAVTATW